MEPKDHWENVYATKATTEVSWFQPHARRSVDLLQRAGLLTAASFIDVGGGASTLVDDLVALGHADLTVLDLSATALEKARIRLGSAAARVRFLAADVLTVDLAPASIDVWHDRAVFHFFTEPEARQAYVRQVLRAVKPGGHVLIATFADDGPTRCSGLPVMRYGPAELHAEFGDAFELVTHEREAHQTPAGNEQRFVYCLFRRKAGR